MQKICSSQRNGFILWKHEIKEMLDIIISGKKYENLIITYNVNMFQYKCKYIRIIFIELIGLNAYMI